MMSESVQEMSDIDLLLAWDAAVDETALAFQSLQLRVIQQKGGARPYEQFNHDMLLDAGRKYSQSLARRRMVENEMVRRWGST